MGIERFFNSLIKNESIKKNGIVMGLTQKINTEFLYLDFNSIIYNITSKVEKDLNYLLYSLILLSDNKLKYKLDIHTIELCKQYNYDMEKSSKNHIEYYKTFFSQELIDQITINMIKENIVHITTQLIVPEKLKLLYISIDGVPTMGKIIEQKKRRYNGYILTRLKKKIFQKYEKDLPKNRQIYEENKKHFDRSKIISWTNFIKNIVESLTSEEFKTQLFEKNINLKQFIMSDQNEFGEGEKKIMEHIIENKIKGKYVIYSPDADVIILTMIANNTLNNYSEFTVLRFNQQSLEYDSIDITILINNIYDFVMKKTEDKKLTKLSITNDVAFVFTLFGNDFVPKLESIDARNNIETLINSYSETIKSLKTKKCLIFAENEIFKINYYALYKLINEIAKLENVLLFDTFMSNKYKNYGFYKRELGVERLYPVLEEYVEFANNIFDKLRKIFKDTNTKIEEEIDKIIDGSDKFMIRAFLIIEGRYKNSDIENKLEELFRKMLNKIVDSAGYNESVGKNPIVGKLKFLLFEDTISTDRHRENIYSDMPHPEMSITDYDNESYKMERKMGEYLIKLNGIDFDLGSVNVLILHSGNYKIDRYNIVENIMDYYNTFFDIESDVSSNKENKKIINYDNINREKLDDLVFDYLKGLFWVFDFYFNKNNRKHNLENISTWFYPHHRSPLLYQVREILNEIMDKNKNDLVQKMNLLFNEISHSTTYKTNHENYMTKLEHYLYVTPKIKQSNIPDNYKKIVENNEDIFPNLDAITDKIWNNEGTNETIECKRVPYINKCNLMCVKFVSFDEYKKVISSGENNKISRMQKKYYAGYFRQLYNDTKNIKYRKYYKKIKY